MGRVVRLHERRPAVSRWDVCGGVAIIASFFVILAICFSTFTPHRTKLQVRHDIGLSLISDTRR
jgi:hypothetical protein